MAEDHSAFDDVEPRRDVLRERIEATVQELAHRANVRQRMRERLDGGMRLPSRFGGDRHARASTVALALVVLTALALLRSTRSR